MRLICHIGTPQTASTRIQDSFAANRPWLAEHGISYPDMLAPAANHSTLFLACTMAMNGLARGYGLNSMDDLHTFRKRLSSYLAQYIERLDPQIHTVVMSSETLTSHMHSPAAITRLKELLAPFFDDITIVAYARRQDDVILSLYSEQVQQGLTCAPFSEFVDLCLDTPSPMPFLYYRKLFSPWADIWGVENIILRRFSLADFIDGDILTDFMGIVQNTWTPDMQGFVPAEDESAGLSAPALEFLRRLDPYIPLTKEGRPNPTRAFLAPILAELPSRPRPVMGLGTARYIMQSFSGANDWLGDTFGTNLDGPFFPERRDHPEDGNLGLITPEDFTELTGILVSKL